MKNNIFETGQITLIPFDIGFMFFDPLTPTNKANAIFSNNFVKKLIKDVILPRKIVVKNDKETKVLYLNKNLPNWQENKNFYLNWKIKEDRIIETVWGNEGLFADLFESDKYKNIHIKELTVVQSSRYNDLLCKIKLHKNLYCFININGIATFVIYDIDKETINKENKAIIESFNSPVSMGVQKKLVNYELIDTNKTYEKKKVDNEIKIVQPERYQVILKEIYEIMDAFKKWCWNNSKDLCKANSVRPYSSNRHFKHNGYSYTMNILMSKNDLKTNDIYYLLNGNMPYIDFSNDEAAKKWKATYKKDYKSTIKYIQQSKNGNSIIDITKFKKLKTPSSMMYFSWSIILIDKISQDITTFEKFWNVDEFRNLLCAELSIQSKWFLGESCVNNSIQNKFTKLDKLEKIKGSLNYSIAELENPTNSQMSSLYLSIQNNIIETSRVRDVYKSAISKIDAQIVSKQTYAKKGGRLITLITSGLLAIFTGCSLFKTIIDVKNKKFDVWDWVILAIALAFTIGSVIATAIMNKKNNTSK